MVPLGSNHARAVIACFSSLDKLLGEIETLATPSRSPLARVVDDLSPSQHEEIASYTRFIREQIMRAFAELGIATAPGGTSVKGPIMTRLSFAEIAVEEADPKRLRGFGALSGPAVTTLERLLADLSRSLRAMRRALDTDPGKDFAARIARFEKTPIDLAMLGKLERVISRRGLVELRGLLDALVEQLATGTFEVAIFGRVSSGKSSLLNAIIGLDLLPVGVTPVTAVPTRIAAGGETLVRVFFASEEAEKTFAITELGSFVSEDANPGNEKRVRRITVTVPSEHLPRGIALVDTPGVGAVATAGARETHTYLPRCDLGVVLLDASGALSHDDLRLLQSLRDSAVQPMIVVSKADLLQPAERERLTEYVRREIQRGTGLDLPVHWVSSVGPSANAREWFEREVGPMLVSGREQAEASSKRKFAQLCESVRSSLRAATGDATVGDELRVRVDAIAGEAERVLEKRRKRCQEIAGAAAALVIPIIRHATDRFAQAAEPDENGSAIIMAAAQLAADDIRAEVESELVAARSRLQELLSEMATALGAEEAAGSLQVDLLTMPALEVPADVATFRVSAGWSFGSATRRFRDQVVRELGDPLDRAVSSFRVALRAWSLVAIDRLSEQFAAAAGPFRSRLRTGVTPAQGDVEEDLRLLGADGNHPT
jgi:GTP-binding protein EngB required for normal cell division